MVKNIYIIILCYFVLGGIGFYLINRRKEAPEARKSYMKLVSYFVIINLLFFSIVLNPYFFDILAIIIVGMGLIEITRLFWKSGFSHKAFFALSILLLVLFSLGFLRFSKLSSGLVLFTFLVLSIFDSFSEISVQLFGRRKVFPRVSPNKTWGGLLGGALFAILSTLLIRGLVEATALKAIQLALGIILFAFIGDFLTSYYKRKYRVKDYSNLIPGHGGFLDRFDSLIAGGAWIALVGLF